MTVMIKEKTIFALTMFTVLFLFSFIGKAYLVALTNFPRSRRHQNLRFITFGNTSLAHDFWWSLLTFFPWFQLGLTGFRI